MTYDNNNKSESHVIGDVSNEAPLPEQTEQSCFITPNGNPTDRHLNTDHLQSGLRHRTISGGVVTMASQAATFGLTLLSTVILARLLFPHDFGLLAMVTSIMGLLRIFKDAGLSSATIQREGITHAQVSNLFWINGAMGCAMALLLAAFAPVIAWFYREPQLVAITIWLAVTFVFSGFTVQHQALLARQMRFKAMAVIDVGSMTAGLIVGVAMALVGYGYWSLVGMNLALEGMGLLLTWSVSSWRPQLPRRNSGTWSLLSFGANMTAGSALNILSRNVDNLLIGRCYGTDALGLYSRAMALLIRPMTQSLTPLGLVFRPVLSRLQGDPGRFRRAFMELYEMIALASAVGAGLLLLLSHPITVVLLGPKWEQAAVIFNALAIAALYMPAITASSWLLISQGRGKDIFVVNLINSSVTVVSFIIGLPFGPVGVALGFSLSGLFIRLPVTYYLIGRKGPVATRALWTGFCRHLPLGVAVFFITYPVLHAISQGKPISQLLVCVPTGLAVGLITALILPHQRRILLRALGSFREILLRRPGGFLPPWRSLSQTLPS